MQNKNGCEWKKKFKKYVLFISRFCTKYNIKTIGAFTFSSNEASIKVLEKNGFSVMEEFEEDGVLSKYLQYEC